MKTNMGRVDRSVRILIAIVAAILVYFNVVQGILSYILLTMAAVFVFTSLVGFCPIYGLFGLNTCKINKP